MAVSLPFVMLAIDYFPLRRYEQLGWGRLVWEKAVWIALAGVVAVVTVITKSQQGGVTALSSGVPLSLRVFLMFESLTFYPWKLVWPAHLSPSYPIPWGLSLSQWPVLASVLSVVMITTAVVMQRRRRPMLAAAWGAYVVLVLPLSGLMLTAAQSLAQRHAYVAMLPLLLLAGAAGVWIWRRSPTVARAVLVGLVACQLGVFAVRSRGLIPDWHSDETRRRAEVVALPDSEELNRLFAMRLLDQGKASEALQYAQRDVKVAPQLWLSHLTLGLVLVRLGQLPEAIAQYQQALQMNPDSAGAHVSLGVAMMTLGKRQQAVEHYEQALRIKPDFAEAHYNLGNVFLREGKASDAIPYYEEALRIKPDYAEAHHNLGLALAQTGKIEEAIAHYEQALRISPDYAEAHCALGMALEQAGRVREAIGHYEHALRVKPDLKQAQNALARLQARQ
jgi:tetratricopeptide (TPR) repeat protein